MPEVRHQGNRKQLEGLFMQELMKSMRASTMNSGMLDNEATEMAPACSTPSLPTRWQAFRVAWPTRLPSNWSARWASSPRWIPAPIRPWPCPPCTPSPAAPPAPKARPWTLWVAASYRTQKNFVVKHQAAAKAAEAATGIPASNILGQAGLESGWGKRMKSRCLTAVPATTCSASRPVRTGRAKWQK